jgi:hypothetical protein
MSFVSSLLQAIVRLDGEAVVLHVGEKPYIITPTEQVDLATKGLTIDAAAGILNQLMPTEPQNALEEFGAVQYQMPPIPALPGERFTIVAARTGDDIWIEIRRRQVPDEDGVPPEVFAPAPPAGASPAPDPPREILAKPRLGPPLELADTAPVRPPAPVVSIAAASAGPSASPQPAPP